MKNKIIINSSAILLTLGSISLNSYSYFINNMIYKTIIRNVLSVILYGIAKTITIKSIRMQIILSLGGILELLIIDNFSDKSKLKNISKILYIIGSFIIALFSNNNKTSTNIFYIKSPKFNVSMVILYLITYILYIFKGTFRLISTKITFGITSVLSNYFLSIFLPFNKKYIYQYILTVFILGITYGVQIFITSKNEKENKDKEITVAKYNLTIGAISSIVANLIYYDSKLNFNTYSKITGCLLLGSSLAF